MTATEVALAASVDALLASSLRDVPAAELQALIAVVSPLVGRLEGWVQVAAARLEAVTGGKVATGEGGRRSVVGWLAETRSQTPAAAGRDLKTTAALHASLPRVLDAVLAGALTPEQAAVLGRLIGPIDPAALTESQPALIEVAAGRDPAELGRWVRHQIATHSEPTLDADADKARGRRRLQTRWEADGSLRGSFLLPAEDGELLLTALEPLARRAGDSDSRTAGQRRADALIDLAEQVLRHGDLPDAGGRRAQLSYIVPADWAARAGCDDCGPRCATHQAPSFTDTVTASLPGQPAVPAEQTSATGAWTGPQTRARIESVLCDARISRVLLDPGGQVSSLTSLTDQITAGQRAALAARDGGCATRGCTRPPALCDAHHLTHRADGGTTSLDNLVLLCRRHHILWHLGRIQLHHLHARWHPDQADDHSRAA